MMRHHRIESHACPLMHKGRGGGVAEKPEPSARRWR